MIRDLKNEQSDSKSMDGGRACRITAVKGTPTVAGSWKPKSCGGVLRPATLQQWCVCHPPLPPMPSHSNQCLSDSPCLVRQPSCDGFRVPSIFPSALPPNAPLENSFSRQGLKALLWTPCIGPLSQLPEVRSRSLHVRSPSNHLRTCGRGVNGRESGAEETLGGWRNPT